MPRNFSASPDPGRQRDNDNFRLSYRNQNDDNHNRRFKQRSSSPNERRNRDKDGDRYRDRDRPSQKHKRKSRSRSPSRSRKPFEKSRAPLPPQDSAFQREQDPNGPPVVEKEKPNFKPTGKLAAASNTIQTAGQTIVLKYHEPAEARKPPAKDSWRIYVFKNDEIVDTIWLAEQSCWLFGRELAVADVPLEHPSCSKQHAVIQFRYIEKRNDFGDKIGKVKPYILDLQSSNGTQINDEEIEQARYVELKDKDVVKFGNSRREYVIQLPRD